MIKDIFNETKRRIDFLIDEQKVDSEGNHLVYDDDAYKLLRGIRLPKRYLFGRFAWSMPYQGWNICTTWNRPPAA